MTIYFVSVGSSLLLASVLFPELQLEKKIRCFGYGEKILKIIMAIIPFFPLGIALVEYGLEGKGVFEVDYTSFLTIGVAITLMHWIWGNGILSVVRLLRESSDVWCTSTIFPVYSWDPAHGEHGQLIESNRCAFVVFVVFVVFDGLSTNIYNTSQFLYISL